MQPQTTKENHVYAKTIKEARERGYWFKAKEYGYGWVPTNMKGWAATIAYTALIIYNPLALVTFISEGEVGYDGRLYVILTLIAVPFLLYSIIFYLLTVATGEPVKWRWGDKK